MAYGKAYCPRCESEVVYIVEIKRISKIHGVARNSKGETFVETLICNKEESEEIYKCTGKHCGYNLPSPNQILIK